VNHHHRSAQVRHVFSRDFTVLHAHPHVHPQSELAISAFAFPASFIMSLSHCKCSYVLLFLTACFMYFVQDSYNNNDNNNNNNIRRFLAVNAGIQLYLLLVMFTFTLPGSRRHGNIDLSPSPPITIEFIFAKVCPVPTKFFPSLLVKMSTIHI